MGDSNDGKRKKDKNNDDDEYRKERKSKRARSRSRSPDGGRDRDSRRKRRHSRSKSRERPVKQERQRDASPKQIDNKKEGAERKNRETDMLNTRTGGAYIPPARLRLMQAQITDKSSVAYQRLAWEALKKSIHGHINKINVGNIGIIIKQLLKENIVRGRGLLCRSVIQAQAASPTFTNVYAALVAAVNSRFPNIGELLLKRLVIQFKRGFKRNDKPICISSASFIAHLVNQRVAHEILALELLTLLVETPTDDSVEVAIAFLKECGQKLTEVSSKGVNAIFEMLRNILHEGQLDKRVQYMIEVMFQVWKDGFKDHPALLDELELVPEEEQFTHLLMLDDATDPQDILNVFKFDDKYEENEQKYKNLSKEILGSDAESDDGEGSGESGSDESDDDEEEAEGGQKEMTIIDNTETNLVALRRTIYLTINSSLDFEECAHKLMKMQLKPGQEVELCHMFLDCCAEQRTYEKFYGLLAQRFCNINRIYIGPFEEIFKDSYSTAHRLDTNRLRNVSKFFAHLLFTDSISWEVLECVKLNEEDTTSSSRIYIKILFQELAEYMGLKKLNDRLKDPTLQEAFLGIFPRDNPKNTRFSINFFTSIGLGGLTDELREHLKQMPKNVPAPITEIKLDSDSSSDSSSSSSSSSSDSSSDSSSSSDSDEEESSKNKKSDKNKKSKNATKDKTPQTPKEAAPETPKDTERWGHQGFYETYGKDARRYEKEQDVFARPRDVRRNDDRSRNRDSDRNENDRRDDRRRDDRYAEDESRRRDDRRRDDRTGDRGDSRYTEEESRRRDERRRDDRNGEREETRRKRDDDERDKRRRNEEESRSGREENDRRRDDKTPEREDSRRKREDDDRDKRRRHEDESRSGREDNDRRRDDKNAEREDSRRRRDDDDRDKRRRTEDEKRSGRDENDRRKDDKTPERDDSRKKRDDDERDKRRRNEDESRSGRDENDRRKDDKTPERDDSRKKRDDDDRDKRRRNEDEPRKDGDSRLRKKDDSRRDESRDKSEDDHSRKNQKDKKRAKEVVEEDERSSKPEKENKSQSEKERNRQVTMSKSNREDRRKKEDSSEDESSSTSSDDSRSKKRDKERKRNKKDEDGWDIRRETSIRREMPVGRYWDN